MACVLAIIDSQVFNFPRLETEFVWMFPQINKRIRYTLFNILRGANTANYIILDVIIDRECSVARIKHISHSSKQNFDNISPLKYDLDFFIPKLNNLGIDLTSFYINKDSIHFSYEDGMPAGVCNTQSGEIKLFSE